MRDNSNNIDTSLFTKPGVIMAWLVICVIMIVFEQVALGLFTGVLFVLTLCSYLWARASLIKVEYDFLLSNTGMFPGQEFSVTRIIKNRKSLPMLWAEIREPCELDECVEPLTDIIVEGEVFLGEGQGFKTIYERLYRLSLIKWDQSVTFKDKWTAKRRGIMSIDSSLLFSGDGFGLCSRCERFFFTVPKRIAVYPSLVPVSIHRILNDIWDTKSDNDGYLKDRTVIKSIRDCLPGDPAKDINMRLLARGQTLKINVFETVAPDTILFVLDVGSFRNSSAADFEKALSVTASLIEELIKNGIRTSLMTPASAWFPETCTRPSSLESDKLHMFLLLAAASQNDDIFSNEIPIPVEEPGRIYLICADEQSITVSLDTIVFPEHKIHNMKPYDFERAM